LVQINTGVIGDKALRERLRAEQLLAGDAFHVHGSMPFDDRSKGIIQHVRWWRPRSERLEGTQIAARRSDLWRLEEGAELLVVGHAGEKSYILQATGGQLIRKPGPSNAVTSFQDYLVSMKRETSPADRSGA
jgi:hypothetical protein